MSEEVGYGAIPTTTDDDDNDDAPAAESGEQQPQQHDDDDDDEQLLQKKLRKWGFCSGICYLIIIICGFTSELGVRGKVIDFDSSQTTSDSIRANPVPFRRGLLFDVVMCISDIVVSVLFGFIFITAGANPLLSILNVVFRFFQQTVIAANLLHMFAASLLLDPTMHPTMPVSTVFSASNNDGDLSGSLAFFFLVLHKYGYALALIFFGVSMTLLGTLIVLDGVFPRVLGGIIALAGIGYVADSCLYFISGQYDGNVWLLLPAIVAEFGLTGWLLLRPPTKANTIIKQD